ncbi:MAG TPA: chromate efflux transporter [Opitutaceae bacterium]|nr:chromate efflux transporter [Opitutaceae bacterium]
MAASPSLREIFLVALRLGCTSFGGPVAHLGYYRKEYVERRRWLDDAHLVDVVALCQFLPGPSSSQTGFTIGYLQRGLLGGLAAWLGFTLPSALLMIGFAYGVSAWGRLGGAGWLAGLKAAAVAVVAQAVWGMARSLCPDWPRRALALAAAAALLLVPAAWSQIAVIALGGAVGWRWLRREEAGVQSPAFVATGSEWRRGAPWLAAFCGLLLTLPILAQATGNGWWLLADRFYRTGSLVFGGGHVVLPLLDRAVVAPGWVTHDTFLAGYGAAQALPGPLFTLSAFLGAVAKIGPGGAFGGAWCLLAIFAPGLLLVLGVLPFWQTLRRRACAQATLRGANAAVVGVLLAAFYNPVCTSGVTGVRSGGLALAAFIALQLLKLPPWAMVAVAAVLGQWLL